MKKTLLGTAAALSLLTGPALAGPALDIFTDLMFEAGEIRHVSERVEGDVEIYEGLEIAAGGDMLRFEQARIRLEGGAILLTGTGMRLTGADGSDVDAGLVDLSLPTALGGISPNALWLGSGGVRISPELCGALRVPVLVRFSDLSFGEAIMVAGLSLDASVSGPDAACLLDLTQEMTGLSFTDPYGLGIRVASQGVRVKTPVTPGLPEVATGETWASEMTVNGAEFLMNGSVELRLDRLESGVRLDGDSLLPLAAAGHTRALARAIATGQAPEMQLPWADLWNGVRAATGDGLVRISGLEVTGTQLSTLLGVSGPLDPGSRIDLTAQAVKDPEGITASLTLDGGSTALVNLNLSVLAGPADPSFNTLPPSALLTGAPISFVGAGLRLSDRGVSGLITQLTGMDPYVMLEAALPDWVGAQKTGLIMGWLSPARNGAVSSLRAAPEQPVPVLMLGMMGMGDWGVLEQMLNVSTEPE